MRVGLMIAAAALTAATPAGAAVNLLNNGSFESGFTNWTVTLLPPPPNAGTAPVVIPYGAAVGYPGGAFGEAILPNSVASASPDAVGSNLAYFSSDVANPHTLSQQVNLTAGTTYNIGFDYYAPRNGIANPNDASLLFSVGGVPVGATLTAGSASGTPERTWINFNSSFVAGASGSQSVAFEFRGLGVTAADFGIDRVYLTAAVPEPGTWAMMLFGFGAVGYSIRRRRRSLTLATA